MKIIIVGGVAGGATAAARLRRLDEYADITIYERGEYISFANCGLPYHLSGAILERDHLILRTPEDFKNLLNVKVNIQHEVLSIDRAKKSVNIKNLFTGEIFSEYYDRLILSPGARNFVPPVEGINLPHVLPLKNIADLDRVMMKLNDTKCQSALVIGGGFIGVEVAENLKERGLTVHLAEFADQVMLPFDKEMASLLHRELEQEGIHLHLSNGVSKISQKSSGDHESVVVELSRGEKLEVDFVILAAGVMPESSLAKNANLELGVKGHVIVNDQMQTSDPSIFAVGDVVSVKHIVTNDVMGLPLAGPANKQARVAADAIMNRVSRYQGVQGTAIIKVFHLTAASIGINEKEARARHLHYKVQYIHPYNHVTYYPGADRMSIKVIYSADEFQLLGAQIIGASGVDKRIDILSMVLRTKTPLYELKHFDFAYAPPYGAGNDPINVLGFLIENEKEGLLKSITPPEIKNLDRPLILDVRPKEAYESGHVEGAINIPLCELRERLSEIGKEREIVVYCFVGATSFKAYRILAQSGFSRLYNLSGGIESYRQYS